MNWVSIPEGYLLYLRKTEKRVPYSDYGKKRFKPFFSPLFEVGELICYTSILTETETFKVKVGRRFL